MNLLHIYTGAEQISKWKPCFSLLEWKVTGNQEGNAKMSPLVLDQSQRH